MARSVFVALNVALLLWACGCALNVMSCFLAVYHVWLWGGGVGVVCVAVDVGGR